ncbi:diacylglycerol/lipid kinase family protein [Thermodesulfobacteriota bacterium]
MSERIIRPLDILPFFNVDMRYAIITNPASGNLTVARKRIAVAKAAEILNAPTFGLDTTSAEEFRQCAGDLSRLYDVIVIAGGDGTLSDIINTIDTTQTPIAYLPLGTGNAAYYALHYKGGLADIAMRIKKGAIHEYDLIDCDGKRRAFMASIGIEGTIIPLSEKYRADGAAGLRAYLKAVFNAYFHEYDRISAEIVLDGSVFEVNNLLSLMVVKQPYYGFGMKVVPKARFDDRRLHIALFNSGLFKSVLGGLTAFSIGNRVGQYTTGYQLKVKLEKPLGLQIDGNKGWASDAFNFRVLPKALKIKC